MPRNADELLEALSREKGLRGRVRLLGRSLELLRRLAPEDRERVAMRVGSRLLWERLERSFLADGELSPAEQAAREALERMGSADPGQLRELARRVRERDAAGLRDLALGTIVEALEEEAEVRTLEPAADPAGEELSPFPIGVVPFDATASPPTGVAGRAAAAVTSATPVAGAEPKAGDAVPEAAPAGGAKPGPARAGAPAPSARVATPATAAAPTTTAAKAATPAEAPGARTVARASARPAQGAPPAAPRKPERPAPSAARPAPARMPPPAEPTPGISRSEPSPVAWAAPAATPSPARPEPPTTAAADATPLSARDRLRTLRALQGDPAAARALGREGRRALVARLGGGWASRRALSRMIEARALEDLDEALALLAAVDSPVAKTWCLRDLLEAWPLAPGEVERVLAAAPSEAARRRLERRFARPGAELLAPR